MNNKPLHLDPVWLRQKYEVEGLSTYDIGKIVSRDPKNVYCKLVEFGIPTRPRGLNLKGQDNFILSNGGVHPSQGRKHTEETKTLLSVIASRPKPWLRGERNGMSGRTGASNPNYKDGSAPERQTAYASAKWKKLLRRVYARDKRTCRRCKVAKKGYRAIHAHHVKPWAGNPGLRFDESNVVTLCCECHRWVHSPMNVDCEFLD